VVTTTTTVNIEVIVFHNGVFAIMNYYYHTAVAPPDIIASISLSEMFGRPYNAPPRRLVYGTAFPEGFLAGCVVVLAAGAVVAGLLC
jgi:hypothetical protein